MRHLLGSLLAITVLQGNGESTIEIMLWPNKSKFYSILLLQNEPHTGHFDGSMVDIRRCSVFLAVFS